MLCNSCGKNFASSAIEICGECIKLGKSGAIEKIREKHEEIRSEIFGRKSIAEGKTVKCMLCVNQCELKNSMVGFCGLWKNENGKLKRLIPRDYAIVSYYYDPLPTNCVAADFCAGCTGAGYPKFSYKENKPETGYYNLAVFYGACNFNCLFCQNYEWRWNLKNKKPLMHYKELASKVNKATSCICYFGGDPAAQIEHALKTSKLAFEKAEEENRILRICFETNGSMSKAYAGKIAEISLNSGGTIKFDIKAFDENLNFALCGTSNRQTLKNFEYLASFVSERKIFPEEPSFLAASTLLIPYYINEEEVEKIAKFIASLNQEIPYVLLAFYPCFLMQDLPATSRELAERCYRAAKKYLKHVRIGNKHLLT